MGNYERGGDFREADRKYAEAVHRRDAGEISHEEFEAERRRLMILDKDGRWWAKSAATGEWRFHDGDDWAPGAPPGYEPLTAKEATAESESEGGRRIGVGESGGVEGAAREVVDGDESRRPSLRRPIAVAAFLLAILLVGGGYFLTRGTTLTGGTSMAGGGGGTVEVPDLLGASSIEEAESAAGGDFEVVEAERVESGEPIGAVVAQEPESGERLDGGSTIFVDVSEGVAVPDVEGDERDEAVRILEEAGFEVGEESEESSGEDEGVVIGQSPGGGELAEADSNLGITVGAGPGGVDASDGDDGGGGNGGVVVANPAPESSPGQAPDGRIRVPDVIGEKVEDAEETLDDAGFSTDTEAVESGKPKGTVVWTDPEPGVLLDPSSGDVIIGVSSGPSPEIPPETPPESPPDEQYTPPHEGS